MYETVDDLRENLNIEVEPHTKKYEISKVKQTSKGYFLLGESEKSIQETLYLNRFPGLVQRIQEASQESIEEGISLEELDW